MTETTREFNKVRESVRIAIKCTTNQHHGKLTCCFACKLLFLACAIMEEKSITAAQACSNNSLKHSLVKSTIIIISNITMGYIYYNNTNSIYPNIATKCYRIYQTDVSKGKNRYAKMKLVSASELQITYEQEKCLFSKLC